MCASYLIGTRIRSWLLSYFQNGHYSWLSLYHEVEIWMVLWNPCWAHLCSLMHYWKKTLLQRFEPEAEGVFFRCSKQHMWSAVILLQSLSGAGSLSRCWRVNLQTRPLRWCSWDTVTLLDWAATGRYQQQPLSPALQQWLTQGHIGMGEILGVINSDIWNTDWF